jgi:hypothetical protein
MPSPVHESVQTTFQPPFQNIQTLTRTPHSPSGRIRTQFNRTFVHFRGRFAGSKKIPDFAVEWREADSAYTPRFVVEVGFSESLEELVRDARVWLEGTADDSGGPSEVRMVVLVKFTESPKFAFSVMQSGPHIDDSDATAARAKIYDRNFNPALFGPIKVDQSIWFGTLSCIAEVWTYDESSQSAQRSLGPFVSQNLSLNGQIVSYLAHQTIISDGEASTSPPLKIPLVDILPADAGPGLADHTFEFDWAELREQVQAAVRDFAWDRYDEWKATLMKRARGSDSDAENKSAKRAKSGPERAR